MTTIISAGSIVIVPQVVDGYTSTSTSGNRVHTVLGRSEPAVTMRPGGLRRGTLRMVFGGTASSGIEYAIVDGIIIEVESGTGSSEQLSLEAEEAHRLATVFSLSSSERGTVQMRYVVDGSVSRELDDQTRDVWILSVDFQEVD